MTVTARTTSSMMYLYIIRLTVKKSDTDLHTTQINTLAQFRHQFRWTAGESIKYPSHFTCHSGADADADGG